MYSRLLVPLDGSTTAELALDHAASLARLSGATVVLLHVIEELKHCNGFERPQVYIEQVHPGFLAAGQALLDAAAARLRGQGLAVNWRKRPRVMRSRPSISMPCGKYGSSV